MAVKLAVILISVVAIAAIAAGCTGGGIGDNTEAAGQANSPVNSNTNTLIRPTWIGADVIQIDGNTMSIPVSEVTGGKMLHFGITDGQGDSMNFMVYDLNGDTYARANLCPPCKSVGFSLEGDVLVCNSCGTRFEATTGEGISGACRDYPKAEVANAISDGRITLEYNDLVTAYANTGKPGWP